MDTSQTQLALAALRAVGGPLEAAFDLVPVGLSVTVLRTGCILAVNPALLDMLGYRAEEVVGRTTEALEVWLDPGGRDPFRKALAEHGRVQGLETRLRRADGSSRWVALTAQVMEVEGVPLVLTVMADIQARKALEQVNLDRERLLSLFIAHAPTAIAMLDQDLRYIAASRRWLEDYRLGDLDVAGRSHYELFPEIPARWREIHRRCLAGATETCARDPFYRQDGTVDWLRWEVRPWRDGTGAVGGILIWTERINDQIRAEDDLRASEARFRSLFEIAPVPCALFHRDGQTLDLNRRFQEVFGYTLADLPTLADWRQRAYPALDAPRERDQAWHDAEARLGPGLAAVQRFERQVTCKDGTVRTVEISLAVHQDCILTTHVDLTDRLQAEAARRRLRDAEAQSLSAQATALGPALGNLAGLILGHADLALGDPGLPPETARRLEAIREAARHAADLLLPAEVTGEAPGLLQVGRTLIHLLGTLERSAGPGLTLAFPDGPPLPPLAMDGRQFERMIEGIVRAAREAAPGPARLTFTARAETLDADLCKARPGALPGTYVRLDVAGADLALGTSLLQDALAPFTGRTVGGLGIACAIAREAGGFVVVEGSMGADMRLALYLPVAVGLPDDCPQGHGETILLVAPEPARLELTRTCLDRLGYHPLAVADPRAAVELARHHPGPIDVCLAHPLLADPGEADLAKRLRQHRPGLPCRVLACAFSLGDLAWVIRDALDG